MEAYEVLRDQVVRGGGAADGLGAVVFHGMWCGLIVLLQTPPPAPTSAAPRSPPPVVHEPQLVRLLANMVLLTQSKVEYAY